LQISRSFTSADVSQILASFRKQLHKASECATKRSSIIASLKQELLRAKDKSHADAALGNGSMGMGTEECKSLADSIIAKLDSKLEVLSSRLTRPDSKRGT